MTLSVNVVRGVLSRHELTFALLTRELWRLTKMPYRLISS